MSWRDLQSARDKGPGELFETALRYTQFLWLERRPARAILALCRAIYLDPADLPPGRRQPYAAYAWILQNHDGEGFLGNPRISFIHQATRFRGPQQLKKARAWALWHLSARHLPQLPDDPAVEVNPPDTGKLAQLLEAQGLPGEGADFLAALGDGNPG